MSFQIIALNEVKQYVVAGFVALYSCTRDLETRRDPTVDVVAVCHMTFKICALVLLPAFFRSTFSNIVLC